MKKIIFYLCVLMFSFNLNAAIISDSANKCHSFDSFITYHIDILFNDTIYLCSYHNEKIDFSVNLDPSFYDMVIYEQRTMRGINYLIAINIHSHEIYSFDLLKKNKEGKISGLLVTDQHNKRIYL